MIYYTKKEGIKQYGTVFNFTALKSPNKEYKRIKNLLQVLKILLFCKVTQNGWKE